MSQINREIVLGFVTEANGYIPTILAGFDTFRTTLNDPSVLTEPHRCIHTIKGASAMVGVSELSHIAFHLEELVELLMHEPDQATPELLTGMVLAVEYIKQYLEGVQSGAECQPELAAAATAHVRNLRGLREQDPMPGEAHSEPPEGTTDSVCDTPSDESLIPNSAMAATDAIAWDELSLPSDLLATLESDHSFAGEAEPLPVSSTVTPEVLEVFRLEAEEHVRTLATLLPQAHGDPTNKERWQAIRRAAHTLKGTAGLVGFDHITHLAHRMEDLLDLYYDTDRVATTEEIDLLLAGTDYIAETIEGRTHSDQSAVLQERLAAALGLPAHQDLPELAAVTGKPEQTNVAGHKVATEPQSKQPKAREEAGGYIRLPIGRLDEIVKMIGELVIARTSLEQKVGHIGRLLGEARLTAERLGRVSDRLEVGYEASALAGSRTTVGTFAEASVGRDDPHAFDALELDRYTEFHLLTRELSETATDVQTVFGEFGHLLGDVDGELVRQSRLASQVENKLMQLRMVPLATVATRLQRTVRSASASTNKKAELVIEGERTGLDKSVLEALADPLLHLLRNAVDHGLESPEVRLALGKPTAGLVTLRAAHEGSHVVLTLADNGAGIDYDQVRATAVQKGLATADTASTLSEEVLNEFLFRPGFSTRGDVSELSGRGVGLDVVKTRIDSLKGTIGVHSVTGRGTTFTIRLPMTLAVVRTLLVRTAGQTYAIPLEAVEQILRPTAEHMDHIGRDPVLRVGGLIYPLIPLGRVLGLRGNEATADGPLPVLLLHAAGKRVALQVDQLVGGREVVIKSLGRQFKRLFGVSGATLLGDGSVVLILNPEELIRGSSQQPRSQLPVSGNSPHISQRDGFRVLVVDDSPSVRRVLTMLLTGAGWQLTTAKDGLEALELLQRGDELPNVILTDVEMPRMDGYELLASVRSLPALAHLPVAVLTSRSADKHRKKALDLGASAYVVKPYQDRDLLDILRQLAKSGNTVATV